MKIFNLIRFLKTPNGTFGILIWEGNILCCTVERPWVANKVDVSCIPAGFYRAVLSVRHAERTDNYKVYQIVNVPGRTVIQIHIANRPSELQGCIAPVSNFREFDEEQGGGSSALAFDHFMAVCEGDKKIGIWITENCMDGSEYPGTIMNTGE